MKTVLTSMLVAVAWSGTACSDGGSGTPDAALPDAALADAAIDGPAPRACDKTVVGKGERTLGLDILNVTEMGTFDQNINLAKDLGVGFIALHVLWSDIETAPSVYTDPGGALAALSVVAATNNLKFSVTIRPIDLTGKTVPADLAIDPMNAHRFNTDLVKDRFKAMVDHVLTNFVDPSILLNLQIGNEIDGYDTTNEHPDFWSDYGDFLFDVSTHVDVNFAGLSTGFTITYAGATSGPLRDAGVWTSLAASVDLIGVTYYPQDSQFQVLEPTVVAGDMTTLVNEFRATGKPIQMQEVGFL